MRKSNVMMVGFIHVILAVLTAQKGRGDKLTFKIGKNIQIGLYYWTLQLGHTQYHLSLDTGSSYTWVQCAGEHSIAAPNPPYHPQNNYLEKNDPNCPSSHVNNGGYPYCDFSESYGDGGSVSGLMVKDVFHSRDVETGITHRAPLVFGCGQYRTPPGWEHMYHDGILGLGKVKSSFPSQLNALRLTTTFFGHCFKRRPRVTTSAGYLFFGQGDASQSHNDILWLPLQPSRLGYVLGPGRLSFHGISKHMDVAKIAVDTGSYFTTFTPRIYKFIKHVVDLCVQQAPLQSIQNGHAFLPVCWAHHTPISNINEVKPYFMPIKLELMENAIMELKPEDYLVVSSTGNVCLGIMSSDSNRAVNVLGANTMLDKLVIYDDERSRIGWGTSPIRCTSRASSGNELQTELFEYVSTNANNSISRPHAATHDKVG